MDNCFVCANRFIAAFYGSIFSCVKIQTNLTSSLAGYQVAERLSLCLVAICETVEGIRHELNADISLASQLEDSGKYIDGIAFRLRQAQQPRTLRVADQPSYQR